MRGDVAEKQYDRESQNLKRDTATLKVRLAAIDHNCREVARNLEKLWIKLTPLERKRIAQVVVKAVYVRDKQVERIEFNRSFATLVQ